MQEEEGDGKMLLDPHRDADRTCVCVSVCVRLPQEVHLNRVIYMDRL